MGRSYSAYAQRIRKVGFGVCNAQLPRLVIQWWSVDHSDKAMQIITWSETKITGGKQVRIQLPTPKHMFDYYIDTYCLAIPANMKVIPRLSILELSNRLDKDGVLTWDVPTGEWLIMRFGQTAKDQKNKSAPSKSTGLDCDKFSTEALDYHLNCMFKRLMPAMRK